MKPKITQLLTALVVCSGPLAARGGTFSYNYQTVFDANSDTYIVGQQNVRKYSEWQDPPVTYWGPSANDVLGLLTMRFMFAAPAAEIHVNAGLTAANWVNGGRIDYGSSSLWASTDGSSWHRLLDAEVPTGASFIGTNVVYNQFLPASLLGGTELWIQIRMQEHAALTDADPLRVTWADAQFSRYEPSNPPGAGSTFGLDVTTVPEPGVIPLGLLGVLATGLQRRNIR